MTHDMSTIYSWVNFGDKREVVSSSQATWGRFKLWTRRRTCLISATITVNFVSIINWKHTHTTIWNITKPNKQKNHQTGETSDYVKQMSAHLLIVYFFAVSVTAQSRGGSRDLSYPVSNICNILDLGTSYLSSREIERKLLTSPSLGIRHLSLSPSWSATVHIWPLVTFNHQFDRTSRRVMTSRSRVGGVDLWKQSHYR